MTDGFTATYGYDEVSEVSGDIIVSILSDMSTGLTGLIALGVVIAIIGSKKIGLFRR